MARGNAPSQAFATSLTRPQQLVPESSRPRGSYSNAGFHGWHAKRHTQTPTNLPTPRNSRDSTAETSSNAQETNPLAASKRTPFSRTGLPQPRLHATHAPRPGLWAAPRRLGGLILEEAVMVFDNVPKLRGLVGI